MQLKRYCARATSVFVVALLTVGGVTLSATTASALTTITQLPPTSNTTTVDGSATFTDQLQVTGSDGGPVTFVQNGSPDGVLVGLTGGVSTTGTLAAGTYSASGSDSDLTGDTGTWTYSLVVPVITQTSPTSTTTTVSGSTTFTDQLAVTGNVGAVTFATSSATAGLSVSPGGAVSTVGGPLGAGVYTATGTDTDTNGDSGTWIYTLSVTGPLTQSSPTAGSTSTISSASYQPGSIAVTGSVGAVTYVTTSSSSGLTVSSGGTISTTGTLLPSIYTVSGTDSDTNGDAGTWTYSLTVTAVAQQNTLVQTSATSGSTSTPNSSSFSPPALAVANNQGAVTYTTTTTSTGLSVTSGGVISVTGSLPGGTYTVSGTARDSRGDTGTWTYSLTVTNVFTTVTFMANGGAGTMPAQKGDQPGPLSVNTFTRARFTFVDWNTSASGSGVSYANGAPYQFGSNVTLYAQWKAGKVPYHQVTFQANGGQGSSAVERDNTPTALSPVAFTRPGYTFTSWNTKASGAGAKYEAGATYSFHSSLTLYAQWRKKPHKQPMYTVTFAANGGRGTMASERGRVVAHLSSIAFRRTGYTFIRWSTKPGGAGNSYANGALYPFSANVTLYAQWHKDKVVIPAAVDASGTVGTFARKSSVLSPQLESEVRILAATAKSHHDTSILLEGYGDKLTKADELNESVWAANFALSQHRATSVEAYLREQLVALGVTSCTIKTEGHGSVVAGASASDSGKYGHVIAELT